MNSSPERSRTAPERHRAGRPRTSGLSRAEQLRAAKQRQRVRERDAGVTEVRLMLSAASAAGLTFAARQPGFAGALAELLEAEVVETARYPQLKLLCWNRRAHFLGAHDAWSLYERNWRFVDAAALSEGERALIRRLDARFGGGRGHV